MAKLTTQRRKRMPARKFGFPKDRSYPIDTRARSRAALARGKHDLSARRYRELAERIHKEHPTMKIKGVNA